MKFNNISESIIKKTPRKNEKKETKKPKYVAIFKGNVEKSKRPSSASLTSFFKVYFT